MTVRSVVRETAGVLSPAGRRWRRFLRDLPIDPDRLARPLTPPSSRDFIMCGSPRTGTTMLCGVLWQPPQIVTAMEPWDGMRLTPAELFASLRDEIDTHGTVSRTRLDVDVLQSQGRIEWVRTSQRPRVMTTDGAYLLGVKWPAWWRYLELLPDTRFLVTLRHPAAVVSSYARASRRLATGQDYDTAFNRAMNEHLRAEHRDPVRRRIAMFDYIHERIVPHLGRSNVLVIRYERWFSDPDGLRAEISSFLGIEVGKGCVVVRRSSNDEPDPAVTDAVRQHCRTAGALGYELS